MSTPASVNFQSPKIAVRLVVALLGTLATARAATVGPPECVNLLDGVFHDGQPTVKVASDALDPGQAAGCIWRIAYSEEKKLPDIDQATSAAVRTAARKSANLLQSGAQTTSSGTTSAISQPGTPFSMATEYGGITSSTSNQTVTLQIPLDGIPRALTKDGTLPYCSTTLISIEGCAQKSVLDFISRFGFSVSMNTSTPTNSIKAMATGPNLGTVQPVTATSQSSRSPSFSDASLKFTIIRGPWKLTAFSSGTVAAGTAEGADLEKLDLLLEKSRYTDWQQCVAEKLHAAPNRKAADDVYSSYFTQLKDILRSGMEVGGCDESGATTAHPPRAGNERPIDQNLLHEYLRDVVRDAELTEANVDADVIAALGSPILSFQSDFSTPQNQQDYWTFKFVGSKSWAGPGDKSNSSAPPSFTLTLNAGASIFNSTPLSSVSGATLLRSVQAGAEFDYVVPTSHLPGVLGKMGNSTAALAYYYQDQTSPSILNVTPGSPLPGIVLVGLPSTDTQIFTEAGHINVAQFKYGFGTGKNVKFPIAVTYSSRTELIAHPTWGAQFGVSYDFTSLIPNSGSSGGSEGAGTQH